MMEVLFRHVGLLLLGLLHSSILACAFVTPSQQHRVVLSTQKQHRTLILPTSLMAGFGTSLSKGKKGSKKKTNGKLKPKKQWDRFMSEKLKSSDAIRVAVRVVDGSPTWYEVGEIKTKDNAHTEAGVIKHRVLISDHARRMFPAELAKATNNLDYGYTTTTDDENIDGEDWTVVNKIEAMPEDIDKIIGFRGYPELTGFYSSSGNSASGDTKQDGYGVMKSKGITGITSFEVHD